MPATNKASPVTMSATGEALSMMNRRSVFTPGSAQVPEEVRTSPTNCSGCSSAAKWPPRSNSDQCVSVGRILAAKVGTGRTASAAKNATPTGMVSGHGPAHVRRKSAMVRLDS